MSVLRRVASRQPQHAAVRLLARWQSATASAEAATIPPAAADKSGPGSGALLVGALTLLGGYIWHSREGNIAHDALVEQLAAESVLCPGEVTTLRSKNKVTCVEAACYSAEKNSNLLFLQTRDVSKNR